MGDLNQFEWLKAHLHAMKGPILEIGSRHYDNSTSNNFRDLFPEMEFVGVDMSEGKNVDRVVDFTKDFEIVLGQLGNQKFNTVICMSVMEHVDDIFSFSKNVSSIVEKDGILALSVPFSWRFHGYPSDYWRFTPKAIEYLYPDFHFDLEKSTISSNAVGDVAVMQSNPNDFAVRKKPKRSLMEKIFKRRAKAQLAYTLAPTTLNFVGRKR